MNKDTLEKLKPFLYGKLLGDAFLSKPKNITHNSRLEIVHSIKQKDYVEHCFNRIHNFCNKPFSRTQKLIYKGEINVYRNYGFKTKAYPVFTELRKNWYIDKKVLPVDLEQYFTLETLAYWYMDDGYIHCKRTNTAIVFCCESFIESDIDRLINILKSKFNIDSYKDKRNNSFRIRIGKKDQVETFKNLINPFIIDSMKYKIRDNPYNK